jgi:hypothetical protein
VRHASSFGPFSPQRGVEVALSWGMIFLLRDKFLLTWIFFLIILIFKSANHETFQGLTANSHWPSGLREWELAVPTSEPK